MKFALSLIISLMLSLSAAAYDNILYKRGILMLYSTEVGDAKGLIYSAHWETLVVDGTEYHLNHIEKPPNDLEVARLRGHGLAPKIFLEIEEKVLKKTTRT